MLLPLFKITGYGIEALNAARMLMAAIYIIRIIFLYLLVKNIVSKKGAFLGIFLVILDPILAMSSFQIRPDNLMMLLITISLYCYIQARKTGKAILFILSGVFMALSFLTLMKILATVVVFLGVLIISGIHRKRIVQEGVAVCAFFLTIALFLLMLMVRGMFQGFVEQSWMDPMFFFSAIQYPIPYGFYFKEGNNWIFGPGLRPISWIFAQLLFPLSGVGLASAFDQVVNSRIPSLLRDILIIFVGSLIAQWIWLLTVPSIFVQYYVPINWIVAVLGGIAIERLLQMANRKKIFIRTMSYLSIITVFCVLSLGSYRANIFRSNIDSKEITAQLESMWKAVPGDSPVFPPILFRPVVYYFPYRMPFPEVPAQVLMRFPPLKDQLIRNNLQYVYNDTYYISNIPQDAQDYIRSTFVPGGIDDQIFIRKN
jgi:4-amino-4-deoxy-L-arabinose transferase-like glycosyltransferase